MLAQAQSLVMALARVMARAQSLLIALVVVQRQMAPVASIFGLLALVMLRPLHHPQHLRSSAPVLILEALPCRPLMDGANIAEAQN
jgi:hypothetical protein